MKTKTCGECRFYNSDYNLCLHWRYEDITAKSEVCNYFSPITNRDYLDKMDNDEFVNVVNMLCIKFTIGNEFVAWLNAPADTDLCQADNTESEGKDEN